MAGALAVFYERGTPISEFSIIVSPPEVHAPVLDYSQVDMLRPGYNSVYLSAGNRPCLPNCFVLIQGYLAHENQPPP